TPTWQLSTLPRRPHHWRPTPHDSVPFLGNALGSMTTTPSGSANASRTCVRNSAITASSSHLPAPTKNWTGLPAPPGSSADATEEAADDQRRVVALLAAIEVGQVALEEAGEAVGTTGDGLRGEDRVVQEGLGLGLIQERHGRGSPAHAVSASGFRVTDSALPR